MHDEQSIQPAGAHEHVEVLVGPADLRGIFPVAVLRAVREDVSALHSTVQANSYGCVNVLTQGEVLCGDGPLPSCFLTGPFSSPFATGASGPLASLSLVVQPWALEPLFGIAAGLLCDAVRDARSMDSPALATVCDAAAALCDRRIDAPAFWSALAPLAARLRPPALALDLLRAEGVEAAARQAGCSARQYRRRFVHHMGLAPAAWLRITRWEAAVQALGTAAAADGLAALSARQGYADQAHLTRETRALVRSTPAHLRRALAGGAAQWSLRPARVRFIQDAEAGGP